MEKPIERNLSNAKEIEILSLKAQIPIGIMLQHRARPSALKLKNILSQDFQKMENYLQLKFISHGGENNLTMINLEGELSVEMEVVY